MAKLVPQASKRGMRRCSGLPSFDIQDLDLLFATMPKSFKFRLSQIVLAPDFFSTETAAELVEKKSERLAIGIKTKTRSDRVWKYGTLMPVTAITQNKIDHSKHKWWRLDYEDKSQKTLHFTDQELLDHCDDSTDLDVNLLNNASDDAVYEVIGRQDHRNDQSWSESNVGGWDIGTLTYILNAVTKRGSWVVCFAHFPNTLLSDDELLHRIAEDTIRIREDRIEDEEACKADFDLIWQGWNVSLTRSSHTLTKYLHLPMLYQAAFSCDLNSLADVQKLLKIITRYLTALQQHDKPEEFARVLRKTMDVVQDAFIIGCCYQQTVVPGAEAVWQELCDFIEECRTATLIHRPPIEDDRTDSPWEKWQSKVAHSRVFSWNLQERIDAREQNTSLVFNHDSLPYFEWASSMPNVSEFIYPIDIALKRYNAQAVRFCIGSRRGERWINPSAGLGFFSLGAKIDRLFASQHDTPSHRSKERSCLYSDTQSGLDRCYRRLRWRLSLMLNRSSLQPCVLRVLDSVRDQVILYPDGTKLVGLHRGRILMLFGISGKSMLQEMVKFCNETIHTDHSAVAEAILAHPTFDLILRLKKIYVADSIFCFLFAVYAVLVVTFFVGFILYASHDTSTVSACRICASCCAADLLFFDELANAFGSGQLLTYLTDFYNALNVTSYSVTIYLGFVASKHDTPVARSLSSIAILSLCLGSLDFVTYNRAWGVFVKYVEGMFGDVVQFLAFFSLFWFGFSCSFYVIIQRHIDSNDDGRPTEIANENFGTFISTMLTMYTVMLGEFDYYYPEFGSDVTFIVSERAWLICFFVLYTLLSTVLLLNMIIAMMGGTYDRLTQKKAAQGTITVSEQVLRLESVADQKPLFKQMGRVLGKRIAAALYRCLYLVDVYSGCFEKLQRDISRGDSALFEAAKATNRDSEDTLEELEHYEQPAGGGHLYQPGKKPREGTDHANVCYHPSSMKILGIRLIKRALENFPQSNVWSLRTDIQLSHAMGKQIKGGLHASCLDRVYLWLMRLAGDGPLHAVIHNSVVLSWLNMPKQLMLLVHERGDSKVHDGSGQTEQDDALIQQQICQLRSELEASSRNAEQRRVQEARGMASRISEVENKIDMLIALTQQQLQPAGEKEQQQQQQQQQQQPPPRRSRPSKLAPLPGK